MKRRTFLIGSATGLTVVALAACTPPHPRPTPSSTGSSTPSPVPRPKSFRRTSWSADPFARGSFSFAAVGSTPQDRGALRSPVLGRVFFAGEATDETNPGTVQGARDSGRRAAAELMATATPGERLAVIGAGMAGITAARQLTDAGYDVVVIEARDRVGGRVDTVIDDAWPFPIELGSSFLRTDVGAGLDTDLAKLGITTVPFPGTDGTSRETRTGTGEIVDISPTGSEATATALTWASTQPHDVSVDTALADSGAAQLSVAKGVGGLSATDWLGYQVAHEFELPTGASAKQVSAWYGPGRDGSQTERIVLGGYLKLIEDAASGLNVATSSIVTHVAYTADKRVSLRMATGESLAADRVIVTIPLGVLKTNAVKFEPALPFTNRGAIAALGMGVLDHLWLQFEEPFWTTDAVLWSTIGDDSDFDAWINLRPLTGRPVLLGVTAAGRATHLAAVNDDDVVSAARRSLQPFADAGAKSS
ncbi:MAG: FAD-dependent oxidoreductase [Microbacteriaceae bacterium]